jgi:hypothetical protein
MRVLKINIARAIWTFPLGDLNPKGYAFSLELINWLKDRYQFQKYPSSAYDLDTETKSLNFAGGKFKITNEESAQEIYIAVGLSVYNDGLVANTESSTGLSEHFLEEVIDATVKEFALVPPRNIRKKLYYSEMDVQLEKPLILVNPKLELIGEKLRNFRPEDPEVHFEFSGLSFLPQRDKQTMISSFGIERKIGSDWSENRYYSRAPLQTDAHLAVLEELEKLL